MGDMTPEKLKELLNGPGGKPPPGITPNFDDPPNLKAAFYTVTILSIVFATFFTFVRFYTKTRIIGSVNKEDYAGLIGWISFIGFVIACFFSYSGSAGVHQWDIQFKHLKKYFYSVHVVAQLYPPVAFFIKLSILWQLTRIFTPMGARNYIWWLTYTLLACNFIFYTLIFFIGFFVCSPVRKAWDPLVMGGHCMNTNVINVFASGYNAVTDIIMVLIPQYAIWTLHAPFRRKLGISLIFVTALAACAAALVKLAYAVQLGHTKDSTYGTSLLILAAVPELAAGIVVGALPSLPKFYQACRSGTPKLGSYVRSLLSLSKDSTYQTTQQTGSKQASSTWTGRESNDVKHPHDREEATRVPPMPSQYQHANSENEKSGEVYNGQPAAEKGYSRSTHVEAVK